MNAQATRTNQIELSGSFPWPRQTKVSVSAPFAPFNSGSWEVSYGWTTKALTISCKGASEFVEATLVTMTGSFPGRGFPYGLSNPNPIGPGRFPPSSEWSQSYPVSHPGTVGSWQLVVSLPEHIEGPSIGLKAKTIASRNAVALHSQLVNDVVFYFPRSNRELWANSNSLKQASAHFKLAFESDFQEGVIPVDDHKAAEPAGCSSEDSLDDSDDEKDKSPSKLAATRTKSTLPAGVREIVVDSPAYTTYYAVLVWIMSGYVEFAEISTTSLASGSSAPKANHASASPGPSLPSPASPKSIYKLAHFLELPELMKLALANYKSQLTVEDVLYQVISDIAVHNDVFDAIAAYAKPNWPAIKDTQAAIELAKHEALQIVGGEGMSRLFALARRC